MYFIYGIRLQAKQADAGLILADIIRVYMDKMRIENGLSALGFNSEDVPRLVEGTKPQVSVTFICKKKTLI